MYKIIYIEPTEKQLMELPAKTLNILLKKNNLKEYGSKKQKIERFFKYLSNQTFKREIVSERNPLSEMELSEVIKNGKVYSSLTFVSSKELFSSESEVWLPVLDHDSQEEM